LKSPSPTFGHSSPVSPPKYEKFVVDIHLSGTKLLDAINAILEIVSCESGKLDSNLKDAGIVKLVDTVVKKIAPQAIEAGVQIVNEVSDERVSVSGDEGRLQQTLHNLVSNAVKFSDKGGIVRVSMTLTENNGLVLTIADKGIGISAEDLPRIMEPFEQADSRLSRNYEGMGLGIPLARAMARLHGGDIDIESVLGQGTTVRITLPPIASSSPAKATRPPAPPNTTA
jgi:signal transduction histidine kinase